MVSAERGRVWDLAFGGEPSPERWSSSPPPHLRFFFTGPLSHFFYLFMEHWVPPEAPWAGLKRLLLDRLLFAPAFLLLFFLVMSFLEVGLCCRSPVGKGSEPGTGWNSGSANFSDSHIEGPQLP